MKTEPVAKDATIHSSGNFLVRDPIYETEKPYGMRYFPGDTIPQSNIKREKHKVELASIRDKQADLKFDECGFGIMHLDSKMSYEDFADQSKVQSIYLPEISQSLKNTLGARHVIVKDRPVIRHRHSTYPISTGENYENEQPASMAHLDFTREYAAELIQATYGERAGDVLKGHWQVVNAWRPLRGPLNDWPLGICDSRTVDFEHDTTSSDVVFPNRVAENLQLYHNPSHRWYYLPDHLPSEVLIFKSAESRKSGISQPTPHSAFFNPNAGPDEPPRESIDVRAFVFYADLTPFPPEVERWQSLPNHM